MQRIRPHGHAVGTLVQQIFQHHDRSRFHVTACALLGAEDAYTPSIRQIHHLGFPGSLGADFVPYLLADPWLIPPTCAGS